MDHITHDTSWTRNFVIIASINLGETQEVSSEPKESTDKIFSPGGHKNFDQI